MLQNYKARSTRSLIVDKFTESNKTTRAKLAATPYCYRCGGKVVLRLFKDSHKSISWTAKNKHLTGNIIIRPWRFVSCWAQTSLRKEKKRKNIESEEKERGKVKKSNDCFHSFFFIGLFGALKCQKDCLMEDVYFCSNVFKIPRRW